MGITSLLDIVGTQPSGELLEELTSLRSNGATQEEIAQFVEENMDGKLLDEIVSEKSDEWAAIGIDPEEYINMWIDYYGDDHLADHTLSELPKIISPKEFLSHYDTEDILGGIKKKFAFFIKDYIEATGNVNELAQKFIDEMGYNCGLFNLRYLLELVAAGATVIDLDILLKYVDPDEMEDGNYFSDTGEYFFSILEQHGVEHRRITKLIPEGIDDD